MNAIAIGPRVRLVGVVVFAVLMIVLANLVSGSSTGDLARVTSHRVVSAPDLPNVPVLEAQPLAAAIVPPAADKASVAEVPSAPAVRQPARVKVRSASPEFDEAFAPALDHAEAAVADAIDPDLAVTTAELPMAASIALTPAVAVTTAAVRHDAVQRLDAPQPRLTGDHADEARLLTDEQLSSVGAASDGVASTMAGATSGV